MSDQQPPVGHGGAPGTDAVASVFQVDEVRHDGDHVLYVGQPLVDAESLEQQIWPQFREAGYEVQFTTVEDTQKDPYTGVELSTDRYALVARPSSVGIDGVPWLNITTFLLTVLTTLYAGTIWYYVDITGPLDLLQGWPFALAVLSVLGVHEMGHYAASRYHDVDASLPYFIPVPSFIGTLGAVIRMKGRMPDRRALFDIGVAGPLAGLVAAVVVSVVGLYLDPIPVDPALLNSEAATEIDFGYPPLLQFLSWATGQPLDYGRQLAVSPVVFGGWVGMFVTFLNLIPVGQLDGGHLMRAMVGERQQTVASLVPALLFGLAGYLYVFGDVGANAPFLWGFWGIVTLGLAYAGPAKPIYEESLGSKRMAVGVLTFVLGALCFMPVPFEIIG